MKPLAGSSGGYGSRPLASLMATSCILSCCCCGALGRVIGGKVGSASSEVIVPAEDVFCPFKNATSRISEGLIRMMRLMAGTAAGSDAEPRQLQHRVSKLVQNAGRRSRWQRLFEADGTFAARTCAVVSSSGVLLRHEHGAEIDAADLVFRFNDAGMNESLQRYVGSREDFRILNDQQSMLLSHPERVRFEVLPDTIYVLTKQGPRTMIMFDEIYDLYPQANFLEGDRYLTKVAEGVMQATFGDPEVSYRGEKERHITTGFHGVLMAASLCKEVRTYGMMSTSELGSSSPYHYYNDIGGHADDTQKHPTYNEERELWRLLGTNRDKDDSDRASFPGFCSLECEPNTYNPFLRGL
mmetsp:Transcript_7998/g.17833  ORF Transcript_7998/g.17833 Transcript_7998/m.17833 type:complete len:354 (-) Transcript_7998:75-1136(-)